MRQSPLMTPHSLMFTCAELIVMLAVIVVCYEILNWRWNIKEQNHQKPNAKNDLKMVVREGVYHIRIYTVIHVFAVVLFLSGWVKVKKKRKKKGKSAIFHIIFSSEFLFWNSGLLVTKASLRLFGAVHWANSTTKITSASKSALPLK